MRLVELFIQPQQDVDEDLRKALSTGAMALATTTATIPQTAHAPDNPPRPIIQHISKKQEPEDPKVRKLVDIVTSKYKVDQDLAKDIVKSAKKHARPTFPKVEDLLAIIGIESSFRPDAVSPLKKDPAVGLTQIRPNVWGLDAKELMNDIDKQIAHSAEILARYKRELGDPEDAVHAYNVGITAFKRGDHNPNYVNKFKAEKQMYTGQGQAKPRQL